MAIITWRASTTDSWPRTGPAFWTLKQKTTWTYWRYTPEANLASCSPAEPESSSCSEDHDTRLFSYMEVYERTEELVTSRRQTALTPTL